MTSKPTTYWLVRGGPEGEIPLWEQLDGAPETTDELHGELKAENEDEVMHVFFVDAAAQEIVTRAVRDGVVLADEFTIRASASRQDF